MATISSPSLTLPTLTSPSASALPTTTTSEAVTSSSAPQTTTTSSSSPSITSPTTSSQSTPSTSSVSSTSSTPTSTSPSLSSSAASLTTSSSISSSSSTPVTSSTASLTSASSSVPSTSSLSTQVQLSTSGNVVFTRTSVVVITPTSSTTTNEDRASTGFFHNKGAVAGVFTVVGLIALIIFFILGTTFIRKRRARKFDKEIDEAAAEAAAASRGPDFDDYDYNPAHAGSGGYTGYSDGSHGTFAQPPMSIGHASDYRMPDAPPNFDPAFGVGAGGVGVGGAGAGAAGIGAGVGTAAMQRARSRRDGQPQVPYNAFGAAPQEQYEMQDSRLRYRGNTAGPDYDLLDAAALTGAAGDPYAVARGPSTRTGTTQYSNSGSGSGTGSGGVLSRNQSQNAREMLSPSVEEDYPLTNAFAGTSDGHGAPAYYSPQVQPDSYSPYNGAEGALQHMPEPQHDVDPYGGYIDASPSPGMPIPNPHSPFAETSPAHQQTASPDDTDDEDDHVPSAHDAHSAGQHVLGDSRASLGDQEDYGYESERRVLRVANE